jgi:hypothetical protein
MLEKRFTTEELIIEIFDPAVAQGFTRENMYMLQDRQTGHQSCR